MQIKPKHTNTVSHARTGHQPTHDRKSFSASCHKKLRRFINFYFSLRDNSLCVCMYEGIMIEVCVCVCVKSSPSLFVLKSVRSERNFFQ